MVRRSWFELAAIAAAIGVAALASATETINYSYDARGRLVKSVRTGVGNGSVNASYGYDKADNRNVES